MYRTLDPQRIIATAESLHRRITDRFPDSGLSRVCREVADFAREAEQRLARLRRPYWPIRLAAGAGLLAVLAILVLGVAAIRVGGEAVSLSEVFQGVEAAVNDVVFLGIAVFFLVTMESRIKRRAALRTLHELRSLAHVVDMHQLTKDPEQVISPDMATAASPQRAMTRFELARYLDYCSESLAIVSKLAALQVQYLNDPAVLDAVSDVQALSQGLSAKIWQKIMILDTIAARSG